MLASGPVISSRLTARLLKLSQVSQLLLSQLFSQTASQLRPITITLVTLPPPTLNLTKTNLTFSKWVSRRVRFLDTCRTSSAVSTLPTSAHQPLSPRAQRDATLMRSRQFLAYWLGSWQPKKRCAPGGSFATKGGWWRIVRLSKKNCSQHMANMLHRRC